LPEAERQIATSRELLRRRFLSQQAWLVPLAMLRREQDRLVEVDDLPRAMASRADVPIADCVYTLVAYARRLRVGTRGCGSGDIANGAQNFASVAPGLRWWFSSVALIAEVAPCWRRQDRQRAYRLLSPFSTLSGAA
jgi:hypothetical protein